MKQWLITSRLEKNRHGDVVDVLERAYLDYFTGLLGVLRPVSNHASSSADGEDCAGLLVTGGGEVPSRFLDGALPAAEPDALAEEKYALQAGLVDRVLRAGRPVIGVCYGMQLLNAWFGGRVAWAVHGGSADRKPGRPHEVEVLATRVTSSSGRAAVNHYHHQGIRQAGLAPDLECVARDVQFDVVEAAVHRSKPVLCLQWHPERPGPDPAFTKVLIERFLARCA